MARWFLRRWIDSWTAEAKHEIEVTVRTALLYAVAGLAGLAVAIFLTLALFWALEREFSPVVSALITAGVFAVIAAVLAVWAAQPRERAEAAETARTESEAAPAATDRQALAEASENMGVDLEQVGKTLAGAGYRMESLVVLASKQFMRQLTPLQFVSLVFVGSFLFGRRLRR